MLAEERQNKIVELVNENGSVLVKEMAEQFEVTEDSIRKDLTLLQKRGLLRKTYGGAVRVRVNEHDYFVAQRKGKNQEQKQQIAEKAFKFIENGDVIFLDISTSSLALAELLVQSSLRVTVVTNMIDSMLTFMKGENNCKVIFLGGTFSVGKDGFVGAMTNQEVRRFRFDKAFMGVVGVDLESNTVSTYQADDATTKEAVLKASSSAYMLLETRKLAAEGNYVYASIDDFTGAILEREPEAATLKRMKQYSIEWIY